MTFAALAQAPDRRRTEAWLLLLTVGITVLGYVCTELTMKGAVSRDLIVFTAVFAAVALVPHLLVRRFAPRADPLILPLSTLLTGIGLVLLHRLDITYKASPVLLRSMGQAADGQLLWTVIGVAVCMGVLLTLRDHRTLQRYIYLTMAGALVLLMAPAFFGADQFGAKRWILLGPLSVQPGEFVKVMIAVFFAGYLTVKRDALALTGQRFLGVQLPVARQLGPIFTIWVISLLVLVFERDLGTSLIFFGVFVIMLYMATQRTSWVAFGLLMAVVGAAVVGSLEPHVHGRVTAWLDPMRAYTKAGRAEGMSNQLAEALFSFGSGGIGGTGLGQGHPELVGFAGNSDFILTTIGEELGLAGVTAVILLYVLLGQRGLRVALSSRDPFGKLLAVGLSSALILQVFVVSGGVTGLIPLTGKALPFLAKGGSSLVANWVMVGLLLRISDTAQRRREPVGPPPRPQ
ncbi:FtsW/RodA/SpoVE family cell cycle protein [Streptomyces sp. NPDC101150]|uniref:FtsW/RodA/SpoVE family cell cycle protein n=1 Tax=Streptomyces sp. NPDC101150 TaxID=3366114 RepID=UPI0037F3542E